MNITPGITVYYRGLPFVVTHILSEAAILATSPSGRPMRLNTGDLDPGNGAEAIGFGGRDDSPSEICQDAIPAADLEDATRRHAIVSPLAELPRRTRRDVEKAATAAGVSPAIVYRWLNIHLNDPSVLALVASKRGRRSGFRKLAPEVEAIIEGIIANKYLSRQKIKPAKIVKDVETECKRAGLRKPHPNTIRRRISATSFEEALKARGDGEIVRSRHRPIRGNFPNADHPLSVVQIDHTPADIIIVEERTRRPMGRPTLTLALDVYSRMVAGYVISMDKPSAALVGQCIYIAISHKAALLERLGVPGRWPVYGIPQKILADNAKEFRGSMLKRACKEHDINLEWRPVRRPHFGGHIERLMGTAATEIRVLPGATFSNPKQRKGYNSEKSAAMTLKEFEIWLVDFIVNVYHQRLHRGLADGIGRAPIREWEEGILGSAETPGVGTPRTPKDMDRLRLDLLPYVMRAVLPRGIQFNGLFYYSPVLDRWIGKDAKGDAVPGKHFTIRYDPADISAIWFLDPSIGAYAQIPMRDTSRPAISLAEAKSTRAALREKNKGEIDERALFEAAERAHVLVEDSIQKTKAARRAQERIDRAKKTRADREAASPRRTSIAPTDSDSIDIFAEPINPFRVRDE